MSAPTVGIFGLTGCAGDQLAIINAEDELLDIVRLLDVRDFLMASSDNDTAAPLDVALVEGAVVSARDEATLRRVRERARLLVAMGTCAVWGGVPALDRGRDRSRLTEAVYGADAPRFGDTPARALHEVVPVDLAVTGCPVEKREILAAIAGLLNGDPPLPATTPVCAECRMREHNCLLIEKGIPCVGALTAAGCDARCPRLGVPCVGCRGPAPDANAASARDMFAARGFPDGLLDLKLAAFAPLPCWNRNGSEVEHSR
jgi:sulfhydrogenase subunit delta